LYARQKTKQAFDTIVNIMEQPKTPPQARLMAAGMIIDRGWGKAAQVLAIDGELRQLVEVKLNVVQPKSLDNTTTKLLTNPEKSNEINAGYLSATQVDADKPGDTK
jgi:hypothetical protein